ncbi:ATP-binding protein [Clostridium sp.]|uniref:ATP-binding protein n=3 Tax=Clostridium sp. TaxID=1506 RepID=UPI002FCB3B31
MILLLFISAYLFAGQYLYFHFAITIFCATFGISIAIVTIIRNTETYYKYIGIGFLFVGTLEYIKVFFIKIIGYDLKSSFIGIIENTNKNLEVIIIIVAFICLKRKYKNKDTIIIYSIITVSIITFYIIIFDVNMSEVYYNKILNMNSFIRMIVILISIVMIVKDEKNKINYTYIYSYLLFITIYNSISNFIFISEIIFVLADVIKYTAFICIYEGITKHIFKIVYEKTLYEVQESKRKESELNNKLRQRNTILKELRAINSKSEKRYCNIIESFKDGVLIFKMGRLMYINNEGLYMLGLTYKEEIINKSFKSILDIVMDEQMINKNELVEESNICLLDFNVNKRYKFKSKFDKDKELELYLVKNNDNREIVYIRDMTEINKYNEMRERYEEYVKQEEIKNKFYSNISHELRTPINLINSALTLNEVYLNDNNIECIGKNNKAIRQNCLRLIRTINNFIDTNKSTEGYLKLNKKRYNIVEVVENATIATKKYLDKINNTLIFDAALEEMYLACDRDMIERVMLNLLSNSVKYGENGGKVNVNVFLNNCNATIVVRNNTRPIMKEEEPYIFDKFTKLNKSLSREKEGSGLGLYLSKAIVKLHNGTIYYEASKKGWNKFTINIPIEDNLGQYPKGEEVEIISLDKKVDVEFSDIYL